MIESRSVNTTRMEMYMYVTCTCNIHVHVSMFIYVMRLNFKLTTHTNMEAISQVLNAFNRLSLKHAIHAVGDPSGVQHPCVVQGTLIHHSKIIM